MKIVGIDAHVLLIPSVREDATDSAQDNLVVFVRTDAGLTGVGESDANPWMLKAAIEAPSTHTMGMGLKDMLMGTDPLRDAEEIWEELYVGSAMNGRRGVVIHAMGALDMALWDIKGQAAGKPCYELLLEPGAGPPAAIRPYASLQPSGASLEEYRTSLVSWAMRAKELGFRAAKLEATLTGPYAHEGMSDPSPAAVTSIVAAVRAAVGPDFTLMVDVQYAFDSAEVVASMVTDWHARSLDVFFIETPLRMDLIDEIAALCRMLKAAGCPTRVAYGEWQATRHEFAALVPHIHVLQPDVGRVGGLTEARRVCRMAKEHGKLIVPHVWKTGIGIAATAHLAAASAPHCEFIEFLPADLTKSPLRQRLTRDDEVVLRPDGTIPLPTRPGLGVKVDMDALKEFEACARAAIARGAGHGKGQAALADPAAALAAAGAVDRGGAPEQAGTEQPTKRRKEACGAGAMPVLVVGAGVIASFHLAAMRACGRFRVAAIADTSAEAAESLATKAAAEQGGERPRVFSGGAPLAAALAADPRGALFSAVWVLVPNVGRLHVALAAEALEAGRHVLLEKPIALTVADGRELVELASRRGESAKPVLMVAENAGFWPAVLAVGAAIARGDIGEVHLIRAKCWESAGGPWAGCYTEEGWVCRGAEGPLFDSATHWLRPLRMWFGEITSVVATSSRPIERMRGASAMQGLLRFASGKTAVWESVLAPAAIGDQPFFTIQGTLGEIVLDGFEGRVTLYTGEPTETATYGKQSTLIKSHWDESYAEELKAFADATQNSQRLAAMASPAEALRDLAVVRALFASAEDGGAGGWHQVADCAS